MNPEHVDRIVAAHNIPPHRAVHLSGAIISSMADFDIAEAQCWSNYLNAGGTEDEAVPVVKAVGKAGRLELADNNEIVVLCQHSGVYGPWYHRSLYRRAPHTKSGWVFVERLGGHYSAARARETGLLMQRPDNRYTWSNPYLHDNHPTLSA